ncbi:UNVERIFIED_CONTAM: hypothetical protein GTU68_020919 [Idotea baltica]|nr:hypothetical protein [Idotea baltica]
MNTPLVDNDGYPRSDIDVYQVRHARHDIICLQNNHKVMMKKIEEGLQKVHERGPGSAFDPNGTNASTPMESLVAFAVINRVDSGSPSEKDGLIVNDEICKFGSVTLDNFRNLSSVGEVVQHSKNKPIQLIVRRENKEKFVYLTPRSWSGPGLLGCNIVPLENVER